MSSIFLNASGAESALGPIKAAQLAALSFFIFGFPGEGGQRPVVAQTASFLVSNPSKRRSKAA